MNVPGSASELLPLVCGPTPEEERARMRFEAAKAAMAGAIASPKCELSTSGGFAHWAVQCADALLAELERTAGGAS